MRYTLKTFGITREIVGERELKFEMSGNHVAELKKELLIRYPEMKALGSMMVAVNNSYAPDELELKEGDEIALIPPVSGG